MCHFSFNKIQKTSLDNYLLFICFPRNFNQKNHELGNWFQLEAT